MMLRLAREGDVLVGELQTSRSYRIIFERECGRLMVTAIYTRKSTDQAGAGDKRRRADGSTR